MRRKNLRSAWIILLTIPALTQTTPTVQQKAEKSACSNIVALTGNVDIKCSTLTPEQGKALIQIKMMLQKMLADKIDPNLIKQMDEKLDEIKRIASQPSIQNNAPNGIAVSGGTLINPQVTNINTSAIPVLSRSKLDTFKTELSSVKGKVLFRFNASDNDAQVFVNDLVKTLKEAGWDADYEAGFGGSGIQVPVPITIGVENVTPAADKLMASLQKITGISIPGKIASDLPRDTIVILVASRPFVRPQ